MSNVAEDNLKKRDRAIEFAHNPYFIYSVLPLDYQRKAVVRIEAEKYRICCLIESSNTEERFDIAIDLLDNINNQLREVLGL